MSKVGASESTDTEHHASEDPIRTMERRKSRRTRVMLSGRIADSGGSLVLGCAIHDISASGARVHVSIDQYIPDNAYLIDVKNHIAYEARLVRRRGAVAGFAFQQGYPLNKTLPICLRFLRRLSIDAKLSQIEALTGRGFSLVDAIRSAGATRLMHEAWKIEDRANEEEVRRLKKFEAEDRRSRKRGPRSRGNALSASPASVPREDSQA